MSPARLRRVKRAFVASTELKPMAKQLIETRSPAAYAGVERWAGSHRGEAAALAWLAIGYARTLDAQFAPAIAALNKARPHAGELSEYVDYLLGLSYQGLGNRERVVATLHGFDTRYPQALRLREAAVMYANALVASGGAARAIAILEARRTPASPAAELALARAYAAAGQPAKAAQVLRHLYLTMPLSNEAQESGRELQPLLLVAGLPPLSYAERKSRAALLAQGRDYRATAAEYRELLNQAPAEEQQPIRVGMAWALWKSGRSREAEEILEKLPATNDEAGAQRLYVLLEIARPDEDEVEKFVAQLRAAAPNSAWFQEALLSAANMYLLKRDFGRAASLFYELPQRFPTSKYAAYTHWKAAWLHYRQRKGEEAKALFEKQVELFPASAEVMPALYWRARLAEEDGDKPKARAYYQKLTDRFSQFYYADLARDRLSALANPGVTASEPLLARIPQAQVPTGLTDTAIPPDDFRAQKSLLLENGALYDLAVQELQAAANSGGAAWAVARIAALYREDGRHERALRTMKNAVPGYFGLPADKLPRWFWEGLFPRPYWTDLTRYASENQLDPFLLAALIRQESEFNPSAVSRANAIGLMQLLPATGKKLARQIKLREYSITALTDPRTNMRLGTRYFRQLLEKFDGTLEFALAGYNAGPDRVENWVAEGGHRDLPEFVESIPFTETREYVQAIVRNANIYRRLYPQP